MTDEEEFTARSQFKWTREGDAWILLYRRRRMGRVVPDKDCPGMWRSVKVDGILSDMANLPDIKRSLKFSPQTTAAAGPLGPLQERQLIKHEHGHNAYQKVARSVPQDGQ